MKEVKKINVLVIGALIFFSYTEISLKVKTTRSEITPQDERKVNPSVFNST